MADPNVKIIISAVDKASSVIKGMSSAAGGLGSAFQSLTGFSIGAAGGVAIAGIAIQKATKLVKESIKETVDYNKTIREMTQVTGLNAESISRIVQVGDDWGISIDSIRTSLAFMNKQGITPSIDNLAKLADQYVNSKDKSAFAAEAVKTLGRGYQTLIPLLALGGQGLRDATAAIDDNLIATEENIHSSREYEIALDNLQDQFQAVKYEVGNEVIPVLTDLLEITNDLMVEGKKQRDVQEDLESAYKAGTITTKEYKDMLRELEHSTDGVTVVTLQLVDANDKSFTAATKLYPEEEKFIQLYDDIYNGASDVTGATDDLTMSMYELRDASGEAESMMAKYKDQLIFNLVAAGLNKEQQYQLADSMGLIDDQTRLAYIGVANLTEKYDLNKNGVIDAKEATNEYLTALYNLKGAIDGIPASKDVAIHVRTIYSEEGRPPGFYEHNYASGGTFVVPPGYPNDSYHMNVSSGEVVNVIPKAGNTTNNYSMNVQTNAQSSTLMRDFNFMRSMAG